MESGPILLFDGVCNLCDASVQRVIKADRKGIFRFASLQSEAAAELLRQSSLSEQHLKSVVLFHKDQFYTHSDAVLKTANLLGGAWNLLYAFWWVPRIIRDGIYNWIAANRYKWFGKKDQCMIPTPDLRSRFLD
ncbi:MAG: thiol-disulfide oxidoreductase DCC family protein [Bacteroidota bacterium]